MDHTTRTIENWDEELIGGWEQPMSLSEMEQKIRRFTVWLGDVLLWLWLKWEEGRYPPQERQCPHCGASARYQRRRESTLHTVFGSLKHKRAYYTCPRTFRTQKTRSTISSTVFISAGVLKNCRLG